MRNFIILGHRAVTTPQFSLNDLPGSGGRMDLITRAINVAFCISHDIRRDTEVAAVLLGPEDPPKTIRFIGSLLKYLNPDERSTGALIRNALVKMYAEKMKKSDYKIKLKPEHDKNFKMFAGEIRSSPGIYISNNGLEEVLAFYLEKGPIIHLDEQGKDIEHNFPSQACTFILSDDKNFSEEEERLLKHIEAPSISLGPISLHTDHCISLIHNYLDRKEEN